MRRCKVLIIPLICNFESYRQRGMKFKLPRIFYLLAGLLFLINIVQAYFTDLIYDEAYYWYYAKHLAWGYFDHPPMVAFMIKLSGLFFDGELGVRFISCVLSVGTLLILWQTIDHPKKRDFVPHFFVLVFSMTLLNAYGFFTLPDTPLLFFLALFLWIYKKFLNSSNLLWAILLGGSIALLMYSKYHAVLIILLVLFSNLNLLRNKYAWIAVIVALLCYVPHLLWLYENNFISVKYHIFERPNRAYDFADFTLGFFANLLVLFGLTFPWIYRALFKYRHTNAFQRALLFIVYGFIIFFFLSSFNRRIQTQWLIAICIPFILIVYRQMLEDKTTRRWIMKAGLVNIAVLLYLRVGLAYAPLFPVHYESHGNEKWVQSVVSEIGDMPVVFENSYRRAPMYEFYSGSPTYSLNNIMYRQNQYSIDNSESRVQHQDVLYVSRFLKEGDIPVKTTPRSKLLGVYMKDFESFRKLRCLVSRDIRTENPEEWIFYLYNPYEVDVTLSKLKFGIAYLNKHKQVRETLPLDARLLNGDVTKIAPGDSLAYVFSLPAHKKIEPTYFKICISENNLHYGLNGTNIKLPR